MVGATVPKRLVGATIPGGPAGGLEGPEGETVPGGPEGSSGSGRI